MNIPLNDDLANDLLEGADAIATYMGWNRRRVYYVAERKLFPIFRMGDHLAARKSTLRRHVESLEQAQRESAA